MNIYHEITRVCCRGVSYLKVAVTMTLITAITHSLGKLARVPAPEGQRNVRMVPFTGFQNRQNVHLSTCMGEYIMGNKATW